MVGYSPVQEYLWYQENGIELSPSLVAIVIYTGNDVLELADPHKPSLRQALGSSAQPSLLEYNGLGESPRSGCSRPRDGSGIFATD